MTAPTRIWTDVDYDKPGKQISWLNLPRSVTRSAYDHIMIPIAVVSNGRGLTALFMAGNHGDEYEGQIALSGSPKPISSPICPARTEVWCRPPCFPRPALGRSTPLMLLS